MTPAEFEALVQRLANGAAQQNDVAIGLSHVIKVLDAQVEVVRQHDHVIWAAKGGIALTVLFIGLIVYVFLDLRQELRRKIDIEVVSQHLENIDRHLEVLDQRVERLRDMMPAPYGHRRESP